MSDSCMDASSIIGWLLPKEKVKGGGEKKRAKLLAHYLKTLETVGSKKKFKRVSQPDDVRTRTRKREKKKKESKKNGVGLNGMEEHGKSIGKPPEDPTKKRL